MSKFRKLLDAAQTPDAQETAPADPPALAPKTRTPKQATPPIPEQVKITPLKRKSAQTVATDPLGADVKQAKRISAQAYKLEQVTASAPQPVETSQPTPQPKVGPLSDKPGKPPRSINKQNTPSYERVTTYLRKETHRSVKLILQRDGDQDFSELVETLLLQWLATHP
jgi:hypothetical protein